MLLMGRSALCQAITESVWPTRGTRKGFRGVFSGGSFLRAQGRLPGGNDQKPEFWPLSAQIGDESMGTPSRRTRRGQKSPHRLRDLHSDLLNELHPQQKLPTGKGKTALCEHFLWPICRLWMIFWVSLKGTNRYGSKRNHQDMDRRF